MESEQIYGNLPVLETERLILRKVTTEDLEDMYAYGSNDKVSRYVTWNTHRSLSDTKEFLDFVLQGYEDRKLAVWGIEYKENGRLIGTIDFVSWNPKQQHAEIGYVLSQDYWGKGIMTEAAKEIIKFGFEKMELTRIQARCFLENIGSERVMEKVGMSFEGIIRKGMRLNDEHQDLKLYSILKEEYLD
ncbi:GNAT family N-acetyltransferase [Alkalihalobacillus sp. AL-G]|uniref:GNAT family N-acetyltransferase n=1 Tax=Alkalihalobacillus sp. AL-G TaxID=2926399 RepID=UPI00272D6C24|nr:GNAT family protein [Alkalihalobacillus sp. AL-G]WLD93064.1 GNAT family N-acetyltransferase [Alkalihalobacillus sp. AL-G]